MTLSVLKGWDYAAATSFGTINEIIQTFDTAPLKSSGKHVVLDGEVKLLGMGEIRPGGVTFYLRLVNSKLTAGSTTIDVSGTTISFDLPIEELAPIPGENKSDVHLGINFKHSGTGKGNAQSGISVNAPANGQLDDMSSMVTAELGVLCVNAVRDDPKIERMVIAKIFTSGPGHRKPTGWHWYLSEGDHEGHPFLVLLIATRHQNVSQLPKAIDLSVLDLHHDAIELISREIFWDSVIEPAITASMNEAPDEEKMLQIPLAADPSKTILTPKMSWKTPKKMPQVKNLEIYWVDTFAVNFEFDLNYKAITIFPATVGMNSGFRLNFDKSTQTLSASITHKANLTGKNSGLGGLAAALTPSAFRDISSDIAHLLPVIHIKKFTDLRNWLVEWPHLASASYSRARLETANDIEFFIG